MTIENNLTRIADALEALVCKLDHIGCAVDPVKKQEPVVAAAVPPVQASTPAPVTPAPVTPPPAPTPVAPVTPAPVQPAPTTVPPAPVAEQNDMTPEELNAALVTEYTRLGKRDPIDAAMKSMGVTSISDLKAEQYAELLAKVRAA